MGVAGRIADHDSPAVSVICPGQEMIGLPGKMPLADLLRRGLPPQWRQGVANRLDQPVGIFHLRLVFQGHVHADANRLGSNLVTQKETGLTKKHVAVIGVRRPHTLKQDSRHGGDRLVAGSATQTPAHHAGPPVGTNHPAGLHSLSVFQNHSVVVGTFDPHAGKERNSRSVGHNPTHLLHQVAVMKRQANLPVHVIQFDR